VRALTLARQDLRLTLRDRSSIFWIFIAPVLWVYMFGSISRSTPTRIGLQVVEEESSALADRLVELLRAENFEVTVVPSGGPVPTGKDAPARSVTIPAGFAGSIAARQKVTLDLKEGERANAEGTIAAEVALHRAIVRLLAGEALGPMPPAEDKVRVRSSWAVERAIPTGYYQSLPGNLVMFVLISTMTYGAGLLVTERKKGILRRLATSPLTRGEIIAGKALGRAAVASVQVGVFLLIGFALFKIDWGRSPAGLAAILGLFVLTAAAMGLLSGSWFKSSEAASGMGIVLVLIMSALGGCWWPAEVVPDWLRLAGFAFPTAWAMRGLHELISWGGGLRDVLVPCGILGMFALGSGLLATRLLRRAI
jgi:ABC-type multidrug transport system permease subunit